ncbi:MAG TPA: hypothetical protein GX696_04310 [Pseudomonadaceae bacterium]|nr:hypothetical protein [Pseudomonadaceae bacterium]
MARFNRKTRAVISGILVGVASIFLVVYHFDMDVSTLNSFIVSTLLFFCSIVLLAALALLLIKGIGRLLRGKPQTDAAPDQAQPPPAQDKHDAD